MEVETYEVLSLDVRADGTVFNETVDAEAIALVETLGLEGQKRWTQESNDTEPVVTRVPYRRVEAREVVVFRTLFPQEIPIERYSAEPIPLRVLQVAAHAKDLGLELYVWCPNDSQVDDPVLIGKRKDPTASWRKESLLLARWGRALLPFEELQEKAKKIIISQARLAISSAKAEIASLEASFSEHANLWVEGEGNIPECLNSKFRLPVVNS